MLYSVRARSNEYCIQVLDTFIAPRIVRWPAGITLPAMAGCYELGIAMLTHRKLSHRFALIGVFVFAITSIMCSRVLAQTWSGLKVSGQNIVDYPAGMSCLRV